MKPRTLFESSVLGAVGRTLGERCPALPDDPGEALVAVADILEESDGTGFVVQIEGVRAGATSALITVENPEGERVGALAPFADADGHFALEVPAEDGRVAFFVAHGALVDPPERVTVRLLLWDEGGAVRGHTAFVLRPSAADPLDFTTYAQPFADLAWAVAMADGTLEASERAQIALQLETVLGQNEEAVRALAHPPPDAPKVSALAVSLRCRFAELDTEELFFALLGVASSDGEVSPAEVQVLRKVARRLDVAETSWQKWAFRMGVELPDLDTIDETDLRIDQRPPLVVLAEQHGRRVPSIILRLDREGQDRRNVFATLSLLASIAAVGLWVVSIAPVLVAPGVAAVLLPLLGGVQLLVAIGAVALGWLGLRVARETDGAGQGAATSGLALGSVALMLGLVWWLVVCMGLSATAYWDQQGS